MRILYLNSDTGVPIFGTKGASIHVRSLAAALAAAGHEVCLASARVGDPLRFVPPFQVFALEEKRDGIAGGSVPDPAQPLRRLVAAWRPDCIYERYALWGTAGVSVAAELGIPHLLEVNAPLPEEASAWRGLTDKPAALRVARAVFAVSSLVLVVSRSLATYVTGLGARPDRVRLFPNAIRSELFFAAPAPDRGPRHPFTLGFCGSLRPWHGVDQLADIFEVVRREIPEARLLVVGDGPGRSLIEGRARSGGWGAALTITGAIEQEAVPAALAAMDVALAPYPPLPDFYFCPLKVFEYQAAGLPVVASRQGDLASYVEEGRTGFLHDPGDAGDAAARVLRLYNNPGLARAVGAAARARVLELHTWERRVRELMSALDGIRQHQGAA